MSLDNSFSIVFVDNYINRSFKTLDVLKTSYSGIRVFNDETEAIEFLESKPVDVIFLNLDLSPHDGVTFTKEIKQKSLASNPFIIIFSDKQDDFLQELAFNSGVDGYINFQYKPAILLLFLKNLLKRRRVKQITTKEEITIDEDRYIVIKNGNFIHLPRKEFKVFQLLFTSPEKFFTKNEIATLIWNDLFVSKKRIIDVHIYNIRKLFGKNIIQSQKGKGYRINKELIDND